MYYTRIYAQAQQTIRWVVYMVKNENFLQATGGYGFIAQLAAHTHPQRFYITCAKRDGFIMCSPDFLVRKLIQNTN